MQFIAPGTSPVKPTVQGPCCDRDCRFNVGNQCREDNGCRDESYCDGQGGLIQLLSQDFVNIFIFKAPAVLLLS